MSSTTSFTETSPKPSLSLDIDSESLPLNTSYSPTPTLPPVSATAPEIRPYLTHLLTSTLSLAPSHAASIASHWTLGSGRELRDYDAAAFMGVFGGREEGWILYREVRLQVEADKGVMRRWGMRESPCLLSLI